MLEALTDGTLARLLTGLALVAARLAPVTVAAPWLALRNVAPSVRAGVVLLLTAAFTPVALAHTATPALSGLSLAAFMLREAMVGLAFAFATAVPFYALDIGGHLVDIHRGASMSEVFAPPTGERTSPLGDAHLLLGVALFTTLGGHRLALELLASSFEVIPLGAAVDFGQTGFALGVARLFAYAMAFGLGVAAPASLCIVLVEITLGLLARAAPSVPVFFAGMPLRAAVGLGGVLLALGALLDHLPAVFRAALEAARSLLAGLLS
jgi:type III secretory pathway component EscT